MKTEQRIMKNGAWSEPQPTTMGTDAALVLYFGARDVLAHTKHFDELRAMYPKAHLLGCSTAGEIAGTEVLDDTIVATAVAFETTAIGFTQVQIAEASESQSAGKRLAEGLDKSGLVHVLVFSDGLRVNGAALARGLSENLPPHVRATGGLVGDGTHFKETLVGLDRAPQVGWIVAVGLYGANLRVGFGSMGGWDSFGPPRVITRARDNILYELDGHPALELYKKYLGEKAEGLPSTGLLFPLSLKLKDGTHGEVEVVRTLLAVEEGEHSMTFAGDMPEGCQVRLMRANFENLIDGAANAASASYQKLGERKAQLAILVSCIGRKLLLQERTEEEVEAVSEVLGDGAAITGFYSYGELCPTAATEGPCLLHNQTMTITTFSES